MDADDKILSSLNNKPILANQYIGLTLKDAIRVL